ncbi:MAG: hypothetical protein LBH90_03815 [Tannerella sp.]|jgi:hypothetical protein|nr:hypothetical protein [Tannerella sp.]
MMQKNGTISKLLFLWLCCIVTAGGFSQNIDLENVTNSKDKKKVRINGGISANTTLFNSNETTGRQPFTYQLNGNVNLSFYELLNIPLSLNLNNYGAKFAYPSLPNRLSLHPSYKWIRSHIGDISVSFSPYTLNGHQFTGGGVELTPGKWHFSAMGGRMLKRVDYNPEIPGLMPAYNRYGYGAKTRYNGNLFFVGGTFFAAKDRMEEISFVSDSLGIFPKRNVAMSIEGGISIIQGLTLSAEYAVSVLTRDMRSAAIGQRDLIKKLFDQRESTSCYDAIKANLTYTFHKNTIGVGYERISPQYETLGAYYFNNDYENITLNYARPLFNDKVNIALSGGVQKDDLDGEKQEKNKRLVGSVNFSFNPTERLNTSFSASTFQGHRNIKSQFDYINELTPYDNLDTLNFTQITNSIDLNMNWNVVQKESVSQNLMVFASFQEAADRQGEYILPGNLTRFLNASAMYGFDFTALNLNVNVGASISNNYSNQTNFLTLGPTLSAALKLLDKQLTTGISLSCNQTKEEKRVLADIYNCRWNANYRFLKKHGLQASVLFQRKDVKNNEQNKGTQSFTTMMSYFYNF